ncbi:MAG: TetR/AcrR family transcriptional regulator [Clostridiales bacterium]|nr:TetR/AcrR family transcriptional regulator [Clostridiales bacterium]
MEKKLILKANVLKASVKLFESNGYINTTTRMIAEEAGVGRGHLSYYFPKKEDIARELTGIFFKKIETFIYDKIEAVCEEPYAYFGLLLKCFEYFADTGDYFKMMIIDGNKMQSVYDYCCENYIQIIEKRLIERAVVYDKKSLIRSVEIAVLVFDHLIIKKINSELDSDEEVFASALRHCLVELNKADTFVEEIVKRVLINFNQLDLVAFNQYINEYNYEEIYLSE